MTAMLLTIEPNAINNTTPLRGIGGSIIARNLNNTAQIRWYTYTSCSCCSMYKQL